LAEVAGPAAALADVEALARTGQLDGYPYLPAVQANLLVRLGRPEDAATAYRRALELTDNHAERAFIAEQLASLQ
jgi:RNA polymerase sigma-70 factor (ECF subfamily)